jgi:N-acetylmuramic acid 6-phosphate etherase
MNLTTEQSSHYQDLQTHTVGDLLQFMNQEDQLVPMAVSHAKPQIEALVHAVVGQMRKGGRLFYMGAGTSGRLGILDASECPPTFGIASDVVIGLIAGGDKAIRKAVEGAEDDPQQGWIDLAVYAPNAQDFIVGIAASGGTPYVLGALQKAKEAGIPTGAIVCNKPSPIAALADFPVEVVVGPEFLTGSTRLKAGTAQKLVLNMLTTTVMIQLGFVKGNKMVDMQLTNQKLIQRGTRMVVEETGMDWHEAEKLLIEKGSVRAAVESFQQSTK